MARKKIAKPIKPSLAQELQALKISTNLMGQELSTLKPALKLEVTAFSNTLMRTLDNIQSRLKEQPIAADDDRSVSQEQLNQLAAAVNKIAAYAAAMDETKKTMIKLTSARIDKLDRRMMKLRVRLKRLNG